MHMSKGKHFVKCYFSAHISKRAHFSCFCFSREQCISLSELLKKFQTCRNGLGSTLQKAEQTIGDQASYMGKDNLQLLISKVEKY